VYAGTKKEKSKIEEVFEEQLTELLKREIGSGAHYVTEALPPSRDYQFTKTNSRSILGIMNDLKFQLQVLNDYNYFNPDKFTLMNHRINQTPMRPIDYDRPARRMRTVLEQKIGNMPGEKNGKEIYQIKISLEYSKPPIWRRIEVNSEQSLSDFHKIIQTAMGWTNSHLHHFMVHGEFYTQPNDWDDFGTDYTGMTIKDILPGLGQKIRYEYDMGDSWKHLIELEKIIEAEPNVTYPRCIKGKRACPPEDCGGIWGYMEMVEIMKDKSHEQYEDLLEWLGDELEPEAFDLNAINEELSRDDFGVISFDL
jgi:hypothetical protein